MAAGRIQLHLANFEAADKLFAAAETVAPAVVSKLNQDVMPLTLYHQSLLRLRQGRRDESQQLRDQATARLDGGAMSVDALLFHHLMANVLTDLGEYRRAIPFWERAIQLDLRPESPTSLAEMLSRAGQCYCKSGLKDHAIAPLRAAVKIFRNCPGDPRLISALVTLGNALRKSSPAEAESCYKEVAELHLAKGQIESATVPWGNLGIVCSEQGRHEEALDYHHRVLRVREGAGSATPPDRLASACNNVANCYRRMGNYSQAMEAVDRAISLIEPDGPSSILASAYGTRGLIFEDQGMDADAVEWLQKSFRVNEAVPSPNLESVIEDLKKEIAALKRLGRLDQAAAAEERLARTRRETEAIRPAGSDLGGLHASPVEGAVLIELGFGSRVARDRRNGGKELMQRLAESVELQEVGYLAGEVVIPETTTLIFYGADGEELFRALEPLLAGQPICRGAMITIRQGNRHRQITLPSLLN